MLELALSEIGLGIERGLETNQLLLGLLEA
jgi:hypothetical protein